MAGPRSLSRSTKVVATEASGTKIKGKSKRKNAKNKKGSKGGLPAATWDHDKSSSDDSDGPEESSGGAVASTTVAGKKRPRVVSGSGKAVAAEVGKATKTSGSKRQRSGNQESSGGGDAAGSSDSEGGDESEEAEEGGVGGDKGTGTATAGGMGDVMARILGQKLDAKIQAPVLAKRKTKAMKEMEDESAKRAETKGKSAARRANMTQQFVIPDHTTADYERQLKKIATRGVVALFNAISKRQNQGDRSGSGSNVAGTAKAAAVKGASRHAFLDMLKTGVKPEGAAAETARATRGGASARGGAGAGVGSGWDKDDREEGAEKSWSVLKEDYMMGASSMKNWDQESADSEADALGGADAMSEDDSD